MTEFRDKLAAMQEDLYHYALRLTRNKHQAEDLASRATIRALEYEDRYTEQGYFNAWVLHILRNILFSDTRQRKSDDRFWLKHQHESEATPPDQETIVFMNELDQALKKLGWAQRKIIIDIVFNGYSYEEMAKHLNLSVGTVKSRIWRAKEALAKAYYGRDTETPREKQRAAKSEPPSSNPIIILVPKRKTGRPVDPNSRRQQRLKKAEMLEKLRAIGRPIVGYRAGSRSVTIK
jgi:RNA polymerase sigma-70 factor (ECF subfamily)